MLGSNHPVIALLEMLERRRGKPWWWLQACFAGCLAGVLLLCAGLGLPPALSLGLALTGPALAGFGLAAGDCLRFLTPRLRGGDDLRSSLADPAALLDGLTGYCLWRTVRDSGLWWVALGALALATWGPGGLGVVAVLLVFLALGGWVNLQLQYIMTACQQGAASKWFMLPAGLLMYAGMAGFFGPAIFMKVNMAWYPLLVAGCALDLFLVGLGLRWLGLEILWSRDRLFGFCQRWTRELVRRTRLRLRHAPHENAIAVREFQLQNWFPFGIAGRLALQLVILLPTVCFLGWVRGDLALAMQLFIAALCLQGGGMIFFSVFHDLRDAERLVSLKQTALTAREYVAGISAATLYPSLVLLSIGCPVVMAVAAAPVPIAWVLAVAVINLCVGLLGLYGLMVADRLAALPGKGEPWAWSHRFLAAAGYLVVLTPAPVLMFMPALIVPLAVFNLGLTALMYEAALRAMSRHFPR